MKTDDQGEQFTTMLFDRQHLVIKTTGDRQPVVIAACYLPDNAALICKLLADHAGSETLENGEIDK